MYPWLVTVQKLFVYKLYVSGEIASEVLTA